MAKMPHNLTPETVSQIIAFVTGAIGFFFGVGCLWLAREALDMLAECRGRVRDDALEEERHAVQDGLLIVYIGDDGK